MGHQLLIVRPRALLVLTNATASGHQQRAAQLPSRPCPLVPRAYWRLDFLPGLRCSARAHCPSGHMWVYTCVCSYRFWEDDGSRSVICDYCCLGATQPDWGIRALDLFPRIGKVEELMDPCSSRSDRRSDARGCKMALPGSDSGARVIYGEDCKLSFRLALLNFTRGKQPCGCGRCFMWRTILQAFSTHPYIGPIKITIMNFTLYERRQRILGLVNTLNINIIW